MSPCSRPKSQTASQLQRRRIVALHAVAAFVKAMRESDLSGMVMPLLELPGWEDLGREG